MKSPSPFSRRHFLLGAAAAAGAALLALSQRLASIVQADPTLPPRAYLPYVTKTQATPTPTNQPPGSRPRVVCIRDATATNWTGTTSPKFYECVDQSKVDAMVLDGLKRLTGQTSWTGIWSALFSRIRSGGYTPGQKIAMKVSFNNSGRNSNSCTQHDNLIDALPHPVLALIKGLVSAGVQASDITLYDATPYEGTLPSYFRNPITMTYAQVHYVGKSTCSGVTGSSYGKHASLTVSFNDPINALTDRALADILYDATYVINMPIIKVHGGTPVSLGFKNHIGSIEQVTRSGDDSIHKFIDVGDPVYRQDYSPLVDMYANTNVKNKTMLTVGDGLYGAFGATANAASSWTIYNDTLNSLFFATDPVAVDCVMIDFLRAEGRAGNEAYDYLFCAQAIGLGICEGTRSAPGGDPLKTPYGSGYTNIEYIHADH